MRNPYCNAAEKADVGASRHKLDRGYDRVAGQSCRWPNVPVTLTMPSALYLKKLQTDASPITLKYEKNT